MNMHKLAALSACLVFAAAQADEVEMQMVVTGDDHETITFDSNAAGFEPADLAVGESRPIPDADGRNVTMTRTEDGLQIEVDGKTIDLPDIESHGGYVMFGSADGIDVDITGEEGISGAVEVVGMHAARAHGPEGVTIISKTPLDDSVRESIRSVLISAGIDEAVHFIDGSEEGRQVQVIRKVETM